MMPDLAYNNRCSNGDSRVHTEVVIKEPGMAVMKSEMVINQETPMRQMCLLYTYLIVSCLWF